jgi:hypothetical protein
LPPVGEVQEEPPFEHTVSCGGVLKDANMAPPDAEAKLPVKMEFVIVTGFGWLRLQFLPL